MLTRVLPFILLATAVPALATAQERSVTLTGTLVDSVTKLPVDKADVYLPGDGEPRTGTDRDGRFRLRSVPAEEVLVLFRRIGYSPRALRLNLSGRENRTFDLGTVALNGTVVNLDAITIEARLVQRNPRLAEFYRRKSQGMGQYLTRQDIFQRNPMRATDLMRTIPGVTVECVTLGPCVPASLRKIGMGQVTCPMRVLLDGNPSALELDMIPPAWIAGVEIYKSSAFLPLELGARGSVGQGNAGCGTIVIWTGADDY
jgi:hypothetical protein